MKIGLGLSVVFLLLGPDTISEDHSGSTAELYGKFFLLTVWFYICGFVLGLPVVLFIYIIKKIPFFDSWRREWVSIFRSKK
tara:strand:+ start:171 stop:413 length:243 start_codon:yes stop_codon:yes gene_type:complete